MKLGGFTCRVCATPALEEIAGYAELPRVTSDCKPFPSGGRLAVCLACGATQKPIDARWQNEIAAIYRNYEPYFQSAGVEQAVFDSAKGIPRRRSDVLLERLAKVHPLSSREGAILDVGCGNGVLLRAFAQMHPRWRLFGHDLSDLHAAALAQIPGFERHYCGPLNELPSGFDVITLIHALEHIPDPVGALADLRTRLGDDGCLFIEVPNLEATPFDLLIADHVSHFTHDDLARLIARAGMRAAAIADDWASKELSAVAVTKGPISPLPSDAMPARVMERLRKYIDWLKTVTTTARHASRKAPFGLFGTSVAAMWLFGQLADEIAFFVDEDPSRRGTTLFDRPVHSPSEVPEGASVYILLIPEVARAVAARLERPGVVFHVPPDIL